ncbi:MAG: bifunctional hydroxymethylpyrimidine kinase/phosphomethylpyrimidine kinase [Thermoplasmatota archaeon]
MKVALTVGGSDSGGGAGIQADLKAFHTAGVHGTSAITAVTAQNTRGVEHIHPLQREVISGQLDAVLHDMDIGAAKTGMLYSPEAAALAADRLAGIPLVVDPIMVSTTRHALSTVELADAVKTHLLPVCTLTTPNVEEAEQLTGIAIEDMEDIRAACRMLHDMGSNAVVITGGHLETATDMFYDGNDYAAMTLPRLERAAHGSGCTFSAYTAAFLALGLPVREAVIEAKRYTWTAVAGAVSPGRGVDVVRQRDTSLPVINGDGTSVWQMLQQAVDELRAFLPRALMPEVGINVAFALPDASGPEDVCAVRGRLAYTDRAVQVGECRFGASRHIAGIVLAAMHHDASMRCAMNIAYGEHILAACRNAGLAMGTFDRADEPGGCSTMEWGTGHVIEQLGRIPDVIWDEGGMSKEAMIRVLGATPQQVVDKVRRVTAALEKD